MAENTETRIIKIEIDQTQALKDLEKTESALVDLKNQQKELNDQLKAGTITQQEYVASKVQLDQKIQQETANRKTLTQTINTESNSLAAQKLKLKELIAERDKIDRSTTEGAKKFDVMNKSINDLSGSIKKAEEQGGSFQRNVGNYKGTIDQFTGGAYSAAAGLMGMVKASLAFIATPIGAVIAAIAVAISSLMAYFKGSEEGQNRLNKIMAIGGQIMERLTDILEGVGEALYNAFANPKQLLIDIVEFLKDQVINRFKAFAVIADGIANLDFKKVANGVLQFETGFENVIDKVQEFGEEQGKIFAKAIDDGARLAKMTADLDKQERAYLEESAKRKLQISELRRKADESEGDAKLKFLNQALELEKQDADAMLANAQLKRDIAAEEVSLNGATKEALDKQAQAEADLNNAKTAYFENTRKMNRERIATEKEINDGVLKRIDSEAALAKQEADRVAKANIKADEELSHVLDNLEKKDKEFQKSLELNLDGIAEEEAAEKAAANRDYENYKDTEEKKRAESIATREAVIASVMATGDVVGDIFQKITNVRNEEARQQVAASDAQAKEEARLLKNQYDQGVISKEAYEDELSDISKRANIREDEIKRKAFESNKKNKIADSIIDAVQSSIAAFRSLVGIPVVGPILAAAAAAAALVYGYKQVDLIRKEQYVPIGGFSIGGYTGPGGVHDPAGVVHKGEVVWNQRDVAAVGGPMAANAMRPTFGLVGYAQGGMVADSITNTIDSQFMSSGQFPPVKLSLTELNQAQNALAQKVQIVEA